MQLTFQFSYSLSSSWLVKLQISILITWFFFYHSLGISENLNLKVTKNSDKITSFLSKISPYLHLYSMLKEVSQSPLIFYTNPHALCWTASGTSRLAKHVLFSETSTPCVSFCFYLAYLVMLPVLSSFSMKAQRNGATYSTLSWISSSNLIGRMLKDPFQQNLIRCFPVLIMG